VSHTTGSIEAGVVFGLRKLGWGDDDPLLSDLHVEKCLVPRLDDLACPHLCEQGRDEKRTRASLGWERGE